MQQVFSARDVLFSKTQQRLLGALFTGAAPGGLSYAELLRSTAGGAGAIHRELRQFISAGLLKEKHIGGHRLFVPNPDHPVYEDLCSVARKLLGAPAVLREALEPLEAEIEQAYLFGSMATNSEGADSDVDVLVVGTCDYTELLRLLQPLEKTLGRHISIRFYEPEEYQKLVREDHFVRAVDAGSKLWVFEPKAKSRKTKSSKARP
ncbi:MAG: nucleotidyltransferase domain-containing protein [Burkholderiales bacterium]